MAFSKLCESCLAVAGEALDRSDKPVKFGATVTLKVEKGVIMGELKAHPPKISAVEVEPQAFVLNRTPGGQLEFIFAGSLTELYEIQEQRERLQQQVPSGDLEAPGDNVHHESLLEEIENL